VIEATSPAAGASTFSCTGCQGAKQAPIATIVTIGPPMSRAVAGALAVACDAESTGHPDASKIQRAALIQYIDDRPQFVKLTLCEECARDLANAVGFFCLRDGGWSKLEPRKRRAKR